MSFEDKSFSVEQAFQFGWTQTIQYFGFFLLFQIVTSFVSSFISIFGLTGTFVNLLTQKIYLRVVDTEKASFDSDDLENSFPIFLPFLGATLLLALLVGFGFILLIIPGLYWALKYQFVPLILVDKKCGIMDAFTESARLTSGIKMQLLGFSLMMFGIVLLGILCLFVGLFIAIPTIGLAYAHVYRQLESQTI